MQETLETLVGSEIAEKTPCYVYDVETAFKRIETLQHQFGDIFSISYALKSNPNQALVNQVASRVPFLDASSFAEVQRAIATGTDPENISYSGPGKRHSELESFIGLGAELIIEAQDELEMAADIAEKSGFVQPVLLRINPNDVPKGFGASMSGGASQFGIDQDQIRDTIDLLKARPSLDLIGFHIYTGSNSLNAGAIAENFNNLCALFTDFSEYAEIAPKKLIFGAGFGLPYHTKQEPLDLPLVHRLSSAALQGLKSHPRMTNATLVLELGRWIVGPCGALLTKVLSRKCSRDVEIAVCDAGFNNHLAACGLMGSVFQKNWPISNLSNPNGAIENYRLAGPLCTSIDVLARNIDLPEVRFGDILAVGLSGAYGLTASPTRFISHPEPHEYLVTDGEIQDITESSLNHSG